MNQKLFLKSAADGVVQAVICHLLNVFILSAFAQALSTEHRMLIGGLCAIPTAFLYFLFLFKETANKRIFTFSLFDALCFILSSLLLFVLQLTFPVRVFPPRETSSADGLAVLFATGVFVICAVLCKLIIFLFLFIKNTRKAKQNK